MFLFRHGTASKTITTVSLSPWLVNDQCTNLAQAWNSRFAQLMS
ncbi:MAG TPA: hypothetical protein V6D28_13855 [Leptolyngbyaceae cyanobacterium]